MSDRLQIGSLAISFMIGLVVSLTASYIYTKTIKKRPPLPPGPKGWPLVGNINDLPPPGVREWEFWHEHKEKYGEPTSR